MSTPLLTYTHSVLQWKVKSLKEGEIGDGGGTFLWRCPAEPVCVRVCVVSSHFYFDESDMMKRIEGDPNKHRTSHSHASFQTPQFPSALQGYDCILIKSIIKLGIAALGVKDVTSFYMLKQQKWLKCLQPQMEIFHLKKHKKQRCFLVQLLNWFFCESLLYLFWDFSVFPYDKVGMKRKKECGEMTHTVYTLALLIS